MTHFFLNTYCSCMLKIMLPSFHLHQGVESGQPPLANSGDPIGRKIAGLQKSLQRDKKQNEKEARKLRDENARLQREMADLSSAMGDARSKVGVLMLN